MCFIVPYEYIYHHLHQKNNRIGTVCGTHGSKNITKGYRPLLKGALRGLIE
jgi:hypothetical protein